MPQFFSIVGRLPGGSRRHSTSLFQSPGLHQYVGSHPGHTKTLLSCPARCTPRLDHGNHLKDVASDAILFSSLQKPSIAASLIMAAGRICRHLTQMSALARSVFISEESLRSVFMSEESLSWTWSRNETFDARSSPWLHWHAGWGELLFPERMAAWISFAEAAQPTGLLVHPTLVPFAPTLGTAGG